MEHAAQKPVKEGQFQSGENEHDAVKKNPEFSDWDAENI